MKNKYTPPIRKQRGYWRPPKRESLRKIQRARDKARPEILEKARANSLKTRREYKEMKRKMCRAVSRIRQLIISEHDHFTRVQYAYMFFDFSRDMGSFLAKIIANEWGRGWGKQ